MVKTWRECKSGEQALEKTWRELNHGPLMGYGESNKVVYDCTYCGRNAAYTDMVITF